MKKLLAIGTTLVTGILIGSVLVGSVFAAAPAPQTTPTPTVPGAGTYGRGGMMGHDGGMMELGGGMMGRGGMRGDIGMEDEVLTLLGMTREQVATERQAGKSLVQIAATKGINEQQLVKTILDAKKADLDALVKSGKLTQAQADQMYQNMQQQVPQAVNRTTTGPAWSNGATPMDPDDCPMLGNGQQNNAQPGQRQMPGRGGMRGGGGRFNGPST